MVEVVHKEEVDCMEGKTDHKEEEEELDCMVVEVTESRVVVGYRKRMVVVCMEDVVASVVEVVDV
jgi:hypothetical protein